MRILVVEDDLLIRELLVEALREEGYDVVHASNGEQALEWCKRQAADVLVTDIKLPRKVDGWQIAERCREHDPALPVIYATGFSSRLVLCPAVCPCRNPIIRTRFCAPCGN
jgi:CheY-like chemotaxis protein